MRFVLLVALFFGLVVPSMLGALTDLLDFGDDLVELSGCVQSTRMA